MVIFNAITEHVQKHFENYSNVFFLFSLGVKNANSSTCHMKIEMLPCSPNSIGPTTAKKNKDASVVELWPAVGLMVISVKNWC